MSKQAKTHAVVGSGSAPTAVVQEGLRDVVGGGDTLSLLWLGPPSSTLEDVYDYVMDNEIPFVMYYADGVNPARVFRESEHGVVQKVRDPFKGALQSVANGGKVLFLWNEDADDDQVIPVFDTIETGTLVLDLTNGLSPISVEMEIPEPVEPNLGKDEDEPDEDSDFTKDELEIMTPFAVKRYGERKGCAAKTKSGIIAELFPVDVTGSSTEEDDEGVEPTGSGVGAPAAPPSSITDGDELSGLLYTLNEAMSQINSVLTQLAEKVYRS